ncbi:MAG: DNA topoisomerase I [Candidatus Aenigmarchaeota archaeon]|nr:DNA topoisomerase I [Candidatus Aenigmarchaeota archaeon]NIP41063.1 DNA topoisomerase I [Candidatus Aenigmarchaeota archaeon]NIQ17465.1 DNA topoisomerase I [Candidatus Aenigmarchaeota archaeon]NIS73659.1 DNA topoisomerase I [Candidatus Aenigmarchaeota archaeon]
MPYTLIIAEKPSASQRIAYALADDKVEKVGRKAYYFKFKHKGKEFVAVPAVGHLFVLDQKGSNKKWTYPVFDLYWKPTFENKNNLWAKKYYNNIAKLCKGANEFVSACDYDIEGSTIAYNILRFICGMKDGKRMKFSTLTKGDLLNAYKKASPHLDFPQIEAGLTRHSLDFLWGINLSRALTLALENAGGYWTLSAGRVQGPTLKILGEREREIERFVPELFWELELHGMIKGEEIIALHETGKFWEKEQAEGILNNCKGKEARVESLEKRMVKQPPPFPFDLTTLQRESFRNFGYSPKMTLDIAQSLYEQALISYPRTSSQKLPQKLGLKKIIENLSRQKTYSKLCERLIERGKFFPKEGEKDDPAHPSVFPTGQIPKKLNPYQQKVYDLIVRRFLSTFADPALREHVTGIIDVNGEKFKVFGMTTIKPEWMEFYGKYAKFKEQTLPEMKKGETIENSEVQMNEKETTPPNRYSQASILKVMEDLGLGTKATRAQILHTLYEREYIREKSIKVTTLGSAVVEALKKHCPEIISEELTKKFEKDMELIQKGRKKREEIVKSAEGELKRVLVKFKEHEKHIGSELKEGIREFEEIEHFIGVCPECKGELRIIRSHATHKRFVGCSGYPKCKHGFPLPQKGKLTVLEEKCENCGLNIVQVKQFKRRPWKLCVKCGFVIKKKDSKEKPKKKEETKKS